MARNDEFCSINREFETGGVRFHLFGRARDCELEARVPGYPAKSVGRGPWAYMMAVEAPRYAKEKHDKEKKR